MATLDLAAFIGPIMAFVGIGLLTSPKFYKNIVKDFAKEKSAALFASMAGAVIGLVLVYNHNVWEMQLETLIITILGWLALIKSAFFLAFPKIIDKVGKKFKYSPGMLQTAGVAYLALGAYLCYVAMR